MFRLVLGLKWNGLDPAGFAYVHCSMHDFELVLDSVRLHDAMGDVCMYVCV